MINKLRLVFIEYNVSKMGRKKGVKYGRPGQSGYLDKVNNDKIFLKIED